MIRSFGHVVRRYWTGRPENSHARDVDAALAELQRFSDHELADIGLSRGCLTPDGLVNCGARRRL